MKIALIAPLMETIPPRLYGGSERVVSYLTEELVAQGHDVTLFASGQSITSAKLVPCCAQALRLKPAVKDIIPYYMLMLDKVRSMAPAFDILHFHIDQFHFPIFNETATRTVTTLHGRQDLPDLHQLYRGFPDMPLVSISDAQREPVPKANFVASGLNFATKAVCGVETCTMGVHLVWSAPPVVLKSVDVVVPLMYALPDASTAIPPTVSVPEPPR